jgi:protein-S-isoprenylcysteine O-methyltransferase Ste14
MQELFAFIAGTAVLAYVSRASLRTTKAHGFYRFFAWELMLVLVVYNMNGWYNSAPTLDQTICSILMGLSLLLFIVSYLSLRLFGQRDANRNEIPLLEFEKTTALVTRGIYRYIRHPMYSSLLCLDWGLFFKQMSWLSGIVAFFASLFMVAATLAEESENINYFGAPYREFMRRTKRFVPYLV